MLRVYFTFTLGWAILTWCTLPVSAQESATSEAPAEQTDLPDGKQVYADFIEATGGRDARSKVKTQRMSGKLKMTVPGGGDISAPINVFQSKPGKFQLIVDFSEMGIGELNQGTNGEVAWETGPQGERVLEGAQKDKMMAQADMESVLQPELRYKTIECVGVEEEDGQTLYRVEFVPKDGSDSEIRFYDSQSKLLVKTMTKQPSGLGPIDVHTKLSDYREVEGLKVAFRNEMNVKLPIGEQKQVMEFDNVEINVELPEEAFRIPESIRQLITEKETTNADS